ncbi:hypothetical protein [Haloferula sp.]|uniref:hypothetical protein n=1 Tax=Haloferula sp. TaxID=2497595 RepID=UPI0032A13309
MKTQLISLTIGGLAVLPSFGEYVFFSDDFESIDLAGPNEEPIPLLGNGMFVGANVYDELDEYLYNYFKFDAPNITGDGARFSNIAADQGGPDQGDRVLSVFSDYNNGGAHTAGGETSEGSGVYTGGDLVDANVFVEYIVEEADLGTTVTFTFDAKIGDFDATPLLGSGDPLFVPEAEAFVKVLDPANNFQPYPNLDVADASQFPNTWGTYTLSLTIDPAWTGKILQAGFRSKTSNYQPSSVFYDNVSLTSTRVEVVDPGPTIIATSWANDEFRVDFFGKDGFEYTLLKAASIEGPYDIEVDFIEGEDLEDFVSDTNATDSRGFYKLSEDPIPE